VESRQHQQQRSVGYTTPLSLQKVAAEIFQQQQNNSTWEKLWRILISKAWRGAPTRLV
jgi:hypothetical protein